MTAERFRREAQVALAAGTLTNSHALKVATFHILANPPILVNLMKELHECPTQLPPNSEQSEQIPYLTAIWYEALRMSHGVSHSLQRVFPDQTLRYKQWNIPPGTPVGMT